MANCSRRRSYLQQFLGRPAETSEKFSPRKYLREAKLPFCSGCGIFGVMSSFLRAVHQLGYEDLNNFVFCSGIGCSSWISSPYFAADSIHTPHGRSIPVATGVKLCRPDLKVIVFGGDGDIMGIGLGHFIHAARRNLDILVIMINNMIYGMTGGQVAPTTPLGTKTSTTPYGSFEGPIDASRLAISAGACYSARWTTAHPTQLEDSIEKAIQIKGFRFIEVVSQCLTAYGRRAGFKKVGEMIQWFKENAVSIRQARKMSEEELAHKIVIGEFVQKTRPTMIERLQAATEEAV